MRRRSKSRPARATTIATGGVVPRGADAVVMIEHTELVDERGRPAIDVRRAGRARPVRLLCGLRHRARRSACCGAARASGSREIGMLAACGIAEVDVVRRPQGRGALDRRRAGRARRPLGPAQVYDSNGAIIAAAVTEAGGEPVRVRRVPGRRSGARRCACAQRSTPATWWCSPAAPRRARAISRIASCRSSGRPASWCTASRSSRASRSVPRRDRRQAARGAAGISDLGDLHLPRLRRAGDPRARRAAAGGRAHDRGRRAGAHRLRARPQGVRAGGAGRPATRPGRVPDRQGLRRGDELLAGRRLSWRSTRSRLRSMPARARASR